MSGDKLNKQGDTKLFPTVSGAPVRFKTDGDRDLVEILCDRVLELKNEGAGVEQQTVERSGQIAKLYKQGELSQTEALLLISGFLDGDEDEQALTN